ncbi:MAG: hypothetical protein JRI94_00035 [Deltaproteobacteria bacterium]|nr:hypothetical protein [Deltaproteobacteria bacterium]MBW2031970.1 hypothetical protein [Deltaproteobacteria bacterium]
MDGLQGEAAPEVIVTTGDKPLAGDGTGVQKEAGGGEKQYGEVEVLAMKMGWNPEHDENSGRPFKSADQYIIDSKQIQDTTVKTLNSLKATNEELVAGMQNLKTTYTKVAKVEQARIDNEIANLKEKRDVHIENSDKGKVKEVDGQIENLQKSKKDMDEPAAQQQAQQQTGTGDFKAKSAQWMAENSWYGKNTEMTNYIDAQSERFRGLPDDTYFEKLSEVAITMFPEAFKGKALSGQKVVTGQQNQQQTVVGGQTRQTGPGAKQKYTINDLSPDQQKFARFYEKQKVMTVQEYVDEQVKIGNIIGR